MEAILQFKFEGFLHVWVLQLSCVESLLPFFSFFVFCIFRGTVATTSTWSLPLSAPRFALTSCNDLLHFCLMITKYHQNWREQLSVRTEHVRVKYEYEQVKENGLILYLESDKEAFFPPYYSSCTWTWWSEKWPQHKKITTTYSVLAYADDIAQTAASEGELADTMNAWQAAFNKYHLKLNLLRTEVMMMGRSHQTLNIKIGDHTLNQVQSFKYLGSLVNEQSTQEEEIKNRIAKYSQNVGCMYRLSCYMLIPCRSAGRTPLQPDATRAH